MPAKELSEENKYSKGSFFEKSHLKLSVIQLMYYWCRDNLKVTEIARELMINKNTVVDWLNFCRDICCHVMVQNYQPIGGPGTIVEIDESKFKKAKYNRQDNIYFGVHLYYIYYILQ